MPGTVSIARIIPGLVFPLLAAGCAGTFPYDGVEANNAAELKLEANLNSAGFLASHEVDLDVYDRRAECDFSYNGTIDAEDGFVPVAAGEPLYLLVGYYRGGFFSATVSRDNAMRFTPDEGRRYAIEYLRNDDGYSVRLYDVTGESKNEVEWESWRLCS